jgi:hypothetical protein
LQVGDLAGDAGGVEVVAGRRRAERNSVPLSKSSPVTANGTSPTPACRALTMWTWALLRTVRVNTHR